MKIQKALPGLTAVILACGLAISQADAGEGCCAMKGAKVKGKSKDGMACRMDAKALKECPFTDKRLSKTDREIYLCPQMDHCSDKAGKCPTCGKKLEKKYCPMKETSQRTEIGARRT